jgi:hypothetical protein
MEWPQYPLTGFTHTIPVKASDVSTLMSLYPECDPSSPPWREIETELVRAGHDAMHDLMNLTCRRLVHMLKETRAAGEREWIALSPSQWAQRFGRHVRTIKRWKDAGRFRWDKSRSTDKLLVIYRDDARRLEVKKQPPSRH